MWIPPETRDPVVAHQPTRRSIGYYGAVRIRDGKLVQQRIEDPFNAQTFWNFMRRVLIVARRTKRKAVIIIDNAKYHHARLHKQWRWKNRRWIRLLFLPPYSPDFNPIERVWKLTRRRCIHNQHFPRLANLATVVDTQFIQWERGNKTLKRLCAITYVA